MRKDLIVRKNKVLDGQYEKIQYQWKEINKQENLLMGKQYEIENLNEEIDEKNKTLVNQSDRINRQRQLLYLSIIIVTLVLILAITISISYQKNKEKRKRLAKQKKEIEWQLIELKVLNNKLKNSDKYKSIFLASMSHELRTPLNSIIGYTGILLMGMTGDLSEEQTKQLGKVKRNAIHLLSLINDILDISKIEAGKVELQKELFKIEDVVKEVVEIIEPRANEKNLKFSVYFEPNLVVFSDKRRVMQVVLNLVSNAVNYTDEGKVHITTEIKENNLLRLSVLDTGIGISDEDKLRLFEPFQQIDSSLTKQKGGTGLGLYLCRKLMQMLGGKIYVDSKPGKGSVFYFDLPIKIVKDEKSTNN
ncbi:MAG: HAMP domain-containing histidine kinase [Salinivirgaceae bacterium]|nr:HAMP domain-containing histidine kinase [Salinivirgaceae bacterium]